MLARWQSASPIPSTTRRHIPVGFIAALHYPASRYVTPAANLHGTRALCVTPLGSAKVRAMSTMSSRWRSLSAATAAMESQSRRQVCKIFPAIRMRHRSFTDWNARPDFRSLIAASCVVLAHSGNVRKCPGRMLSWPLDIYVGHCFSHSNHRLIVRAGTSPLPSRNCPRSPSKPRR